MAKESRSHNLEVTFADRSEAERAMAALRSEGVSVSVGSADEAAALRGEMRDELEATVVGPGNVGPFTKGMSRGLVVWVPLGILIGAALGFLIGLLPWPWDRTVTLVITTVVGAVAGAVAGFSFGGFLGSRREGEGREFAAERGTVIGIRARSDEELAQAEEIVGRFGPERVDRVTPEGEPMWGSAEERTQPVRGQVPSTPGEEEQPRQ